MPESVIFDGQLHKEPVSRSRIVGGVPNLAPSLSFGNICIIDTGLGAGFTLGKGSTGSGGANQLDDYLYEFNSASDMKNHVMGGKLWDAAQYLYNPSNDLQGASKVFFIKASTATPASVSFTFDSTAAISFSTKRDHGTGCNGIFVNASSDKRLYQGYGVRLQAGEVDSSKFQFVFFLGSWRGQDSDNLLYEGLTKAQSANKKSVITVHKSEEFVDVSDFVSWFNSDSSFSSLFEITSSTNGVIATADLTTYSDLQLFSGATEIYNTTSLDNALDRIDELDCSFFLATKSGVDANGTENNSILSHIINDSSFKKFMVVGLRDDQTGFEATTTGSKAMAEAYGTQNVIGCHGGDSIPYVLNNSILQDKDSFYFACKVVGALSGLQPQTPLTYKRLRMGKAQHILTKAERESALDSGVLHMKNDPDLGWIVNQAVNTSSQNTQPFFPDGSSYQISISRIAFQLDKEIQSGGKAFIGGNLGTVTESDVINFAVSYLNTKIVKNNVDNLIIDFRNIRAERAGSTWYLYYDFQPNLPIDKFFSTGTMIDPTLNA